MNVAGNDAFWAALAPDPLPGIDDEQRRQLHDGIVSATEGVNWEQFLVDIGHQPPPSARAYRRAFTKAIGAADGGLDIPRLRQTLDTFGAQLLALSIDPNTTVRKLRRRLWKTLKVIGAIVVVGTAGVALHQALAVSGGLAALAGIATNIGLNPELVTAFVEAVGVDRALKVVEFFLKRGKPADAEVPGNEAYDALDRINGIDENRLADIRRDWRAGSGTEHVGAEDFLADTERRLHGLLSAGIRTEWFSAATEQQCRTILSTLDQLKDLRKNAGANRDHITASFDALADALPVLKDALDNDVIPTDPSQPTARADVVARHKRVNEWAARHPVKPKTGPKASPPDPGSGENPPTE